MTTVRPAWDCEAFVMQWRTGRGEHDHLHITSPSGRRIQLTESPSGRRLHIYVDGRRYTPGEPS